ncbi:MAG TPA: lipopolysaccharide heptosyltransferase II, partial [bacterium]|nr:lipopolysaccharide heptosyltransferase II [bacterium]
GYAKDMRGFLLSHAVKRDAGTLKLHHRDYYYRLIREIGDVGEPAAPRIDVGAQPAGWAAQACSGAEKTGKPLIGICPGGAFGPAKRWPAERFGELAAQLSERFGAGIVVCGGENDAPLAERIREACGELTDLTGRTDLVQLAAVLARCDVVVANDSGPMHVASAAGAPVVAIFGSTDPRVTSPAGAHVIVSKQLSCAPCLERTCEKDYACLKAVTVRDVMDAVEKVLAGASQRAAR